MWDKGQGQRILKEFQRIYWIYSDQDHLNLAKLRYRHLRQRKRKNHNRNRTIQTRTFHPKKTNNLKRQKDKQLFLKYEQTKNYFTINKKLSYRI